MKIKFLSVFFLYAIITGIFYRIQAQDIDFQAPNYDEIKKEITQKGSDCYYPTLLERFHNSDFSLTIEQLRALYFGTIFQDNYAPYLTCPELNEINEQINKEHPTTKELDKALATLAKVETKYPTHLTLYLYKTILSHLRFGENSDELAKAQNQLFMLANAIMSTGDGTDYDKAYHIVYTSHSYIMMEIFGFSPTQQELRNHEEQSYDVFELDENEEGIDEFYFNISPCFKYLNNVFSDVKNTEQEPQSEVFIPLNSQFTIELIKGKKDTTLLKIIDIHPFTGTLCWDQDNDLEFASDRPNLINGYFCIANYCANSEGKSKVVLMFKSNADVSPMEYDSALQYNGGDKFYPTSNVGAFSGAVITEMWSADNGITAIRLGNFRK